MSGGKQRSDGSKHSDILVGVALLLLAAVFAYLGFSQPKISNDYTVTDAQTQIYQPDFDITSDNIEETSSENTTAGNLNGAQSNQQNNESGVSSVSFPVNLNTCTKEQLMEIDGIGEARADAILAYREHLGGYTSTEQLMEISGIGETIYSKIAPYVTV